MAQNNNLDRRLLALLGENPDADTLFYLMDRLLTLAGEQGVICHWQLQQDERLLSVVDKLHQLVETGELMPCPSLEELRTRIALQMVYTSDMSYDEINERIAPLLAARDARIAELEKALGDKQ